MKGWILPAVGTFFLWGLWGFIPKITTRYITPRSAVLYEVIGGLMVGLVVLYSLNFRPETDPRGIVPAVLTGVFGLLGAFCFLQAVSRGPVSLVVVMTALYPVLTIILAMALLHEEITLRQGVGIVLAIIAMLLIAK